MRRNCVVVAGPGTLNQRNNHSRSGYGTDRGRDQCNANRAHEAWRRGEVAPLRMKISGRTHHHNLQDNTGVARATMPLSEGQTRHCQAGSSFAEIVRTRSIRRPDSITGHSGTRQAAESKIWNSVANPHQHRSDYFRLGLLPARIHSKLSTIVRVSRRNAARIRMLAARASPQVSPPTHVPADENPRYSLRLLPAPHRHQPGRVAAPAPITCARYRGCNS